MIRSLFKFSSKNSLLKLGLATAGLLALKEKQQLTQNCGIVGYVGHRPIAVQVLIQGLSQLQNRGYDSAGILTLKDGGIQLTKYASDPQKVSDCLPRVTQEVQQKKIQAYIGIGHTRWATHGRKVDLNAHPHCDHKQRIYLAHNGTIDNTREILNFLNNHGIHPKTETDTQMIALMIGLYMDEGHDFLSAVQTVLSRISGTWGLICVHKDNPEQILVARRGSPIVIGLGEGEFFVGSQISAFSKYTDKYYSLQDGEIAVLNPKKQEFAVNKVETIPEGFGTTSLGNFLHWTLKQINQQPESVARALNFGARLTKDGAKLGGLQKYQDAFMQIENLLLLGCGTSLNAAMFGAQIFKKFGIFNTVQAIDASEALIEDLPQNKPGVIAISQSGQTHDLLAPLRLYRALDVPAISIVNVVASQLAKLTGVGVYMNSGREIAVASTKSFMNSCVILAEIALWASKLCHPQESLKREQLIKSLIKLPLQIGSQISMNTPQCKKIAKEIKNNDHLYILGRGLGDPIAKEGALKIKEVSYMHAEGFAAGALKHGTFALIEEGTPVVLLIMNDEYTDLMVNVFEQLHCRGAKTIVITSDPNLIKSNKVPDHIIKIQDAGMMTALLAAVPLQLLAFHLSLQRGHHPDKPRNLAKVVTTP